MSTSVSELYDLPSAYGDEAEEYQTLLFLGNQRTTTGNISFTSATSSAIYDTSVGTGVPAEDANIIDKGQSGLFYWLGLDSVLGTYNIKKVVWDQIRADFNTLFAQSNGWILANATWTYASSTTITVPDGSIFRKGDTIKFTQTTVRYFYVIEISGNTLTLTGGSDYSVSNAAITNNCYSHIKPYDFPDFFNWTPTYTGFSVDPTDVASRFSIDGDKLFFDHSEGTNGTSNDTTFVITLPVRTKDISNGSWGGIITYAIDNSSIISTACRWYLSNNDITLSLYTDMSTGAWTSSGSKRARLQGWYEY